MVMDASTLMNDTQMDMQAIDQMAAGEYRQSVREQMPRDYVQFYHPDGTTSIVQLPPAGKNGRGRKDRQQKIMHMVMNKRRSVRQPDGTFKSVQWWYPSPPAGWEPQPLKWRCPVQECTRAGGLPDLLNMYRHIMQKHPGEKDLYEGVIKAIKQKLAAAIPADLATLLSEDGEKAPVIAQAEIDAARFEDAASVMDTPAVAPETFSPLACACGWTTEKGEHSLLSHQRSRWCPLNQKEVSDG